MRLIHQWSRGRVAPLQKIELSDRILYLNFSLGFRENFRMGKIKSRKTAGCQDMAYLVSISLPTFVARTPPFKQSSSAISAGCDFKWLSVYNTAPVPNFDPVPKFDSGLGHGSAGQYFFPPRVVRGAARRLLCSSFLSAEGPPFNQPAGPAELGIENDNPDFAPSVLWVPLAPVGPWTLLQSGSQYLIQHIEFPGQFLTSVISGSLDLEDGPVGDAQKWNITCTTCHSDGLATDCTFANNPFPNTPFDSENCILNDRLLDLGNFTVTGDCSTGGTSLTMNYHL
ncbi:hypothetical protein B0H12DRAFT_1082856 [Mycena haematopus]|nr:hypothetical protein B0H12DRAFT_1082856 [Mycena haematopus]